MGLIQLRDYKFIWNLWRKYETLKPFETDDSDVESRNLFFTNCELNVSTIYERFTDQFFRN